MTSDDRIPNLLFLLSFSPLVAGCPGGDDTGSGETTTGTPMTTGPSTSTADGTGTGPATTTGMEGSSGGSTAAATTDADTTAGETEGETTGGLYCEDNPPMMVGPIDPVCVDFANQYNECYYDSGLSQLCLDYYQAYCQYGIEYAIMAYGEMCGMATVEFYACITQLSCVELEQPDVCMEEFVALQAACVPE